MLRTPKPTVRPKSYPLPELQEDYVSINVDYKELAPIVKPIVKPMPEPPKITITTEESLVEPVVKVPNIGSINYDIPTRNDTAILLVFFDYTGSVKILMNYLFMREKLKLANIPVFTLELVIEGASPKISNSIRVYGRSYLFQKEHLIRLLEKQIPTRFTKIVCLDADVLFDDLNWYDKLSVLLDTHQIVHCFRNAYWLDASYTEIQQQARTCFLVEKDNRFFNNPNKVYHPGFGWAFDRRWYKQSGFYDLAIVGSGDTLFAYGVMGYPINERETETRIYKHSYRNWYNNLAKASCTYFSGNIYHLYHGSLAKRQYISRYDYFKDHANIEDCVKQNSYGVYELIEPTINSNMLTFFRTRDDDGID